MSSSTPALKKPGAAPRRNSLAKLMASRRRQMQGFAKLQTWDGPAIPVLLTGVGPGAQPESPDQLRQYLAICLELAKAGDLNVACENVKDPSVGKDVASMPGGGYKVIFGVNPSTASSASTVAHGPTWSTSTPPSAVSDGQSGHAAAGASSDTATDDNATDDVPAGNDVIETDASTATPTTSTNQQLTIEALSEDEVDELEAEGLEASDRHRGLSTPSDGAPAPKKARTDKTAPDTRCQRCQLTGQACVHGTNDAKGHIPSDCAGCLSVGATCSFNSDPPNPAITHTPTKTYDGNNWKGFESLSTRAVLYSWLSGCVAAGHYEEMWKLSALFMYDRVAFSNHVSAFFLSNGQLTIDTINPV